MAYTVKQVAKLSGVSVRTLHFYHEMGLLNPARIGTNGYRFYEEPQLLNLQQILFYRELGFELRQIKKIVGRRDFEKIAALQSHREVLIKNLARTRQLVATIDKTVQHLKGARQMKTEEIFAGFSVPAGQDRFGEPTKLGDQRLNVKVSGKDTNGAMCVFEFTGPGGPKHLHYDQDEWIYVLEGEYLFEVAGKRIRIKEGESIFLPRKVPHAWTNLQENVGKILNVYQPAGKVEEFFRAIEKYKDKPTKEQVLNKSYTDKQKLDFNNMFESHGMDLMGGPLLPD